MDRCPGSLACLEPQRARPSGYKEETTVPALETHAHKGGINTVITDTVGNHMRRESELGFGCKNI